MRRNAPYILLAVSVILLVALVPGWSEGDGDVISIDTLDYDPTGRTLIIGGSVSDDSAVVYFSFADSDGNRVIGDGFAPVDDGRFNREVAVPLSVIAGEYDLTVYTSSMIKSVRSFEITDSPKPAVSVGSTTATVTSGNTILIPLVLTGVSYADLATDVSDSKVASSKVGPEGLEITGVSEGDCSVIVYVVGESGISAEVSVHVTKAPVSTETKNYSFFIQIAKDFDKASYGVYSESDLRSGITISAQGYDAAEALMKACAAKGIDCSMNSDPNDTYYGWILSLFGLKQYQTPGDTSVWTYWVQYHNGSYNQWTLGHYTDGGSFSLIWKSTDEGGSDVDVPPDKPSSSETTTNPDGSTTTTTTTTEKDDSGNTTEKVESTTTNKDGSTSSTVTETMKDASGNITSVTESTSTTSKGDDGSKVTEGTKTTTTSSGVTSETSKVTEKETEDGSEVRTESTSTVKDASGNVTETKETVTEVITTSDSVTEVITTETVRNGVTERTESAVFEYGDGTITSKVENAIGSDGKAKSTSVTTIDVSDGQLTADQARIAVDGTEGAIGRLPTAPASIEKVVEVRSVDASVSVDPKALETLSGFGSGLKIVGDNGSIHVDGDVCDSLSGKSSAVTFSMEADAKDILNDKQKQVVGDSRFIDLSAKVGDERIHQLGGTATVTFGYTPSATDDVSRLCIYYVDENGDRFMVTSSFDRDTGTFTIEVDHFSIFMVGTAEESADGGFPTSAVAIVIVVAILAVVGAVVYHSRRS